MVKTIDDTVKDEKCSEIVPKHYGKYIALPSFKDLLHSTNIIAYGKNLVKVLNEAKKKGYEEPVMDYVFKPGTVHVH